MTMLYRLDADAAAVGNAFGLRTGDDPWPGGHVAPGGFAPVITTGREFIAGPGEPNQPRRMVPRLWGVPPPPNAHDAARPVLSVRNADSPFWIGNLRNPEFRCIVPATAFMEWGRIGTDGKRRQHWFACADQQVFAMAGVWKDSEVPGFALLTCAPNAELRHAGREAMPVILPRDPQAHDTWLRAGWDTASALLQPYSSSLMQVVER
ncbi:SOS response-associated peptidase [Erythrobacter westpacificensis]|uniref:Abasic site processing protein n=2 Tax=Erythrobacter westpacificensis TaxID=1055231 RepID=A0ABP9K2A1_9SPHN